MTPMARWAFWGGDMSPQIRSQLLRALLQSTDDSGSQQLMKLTGLAGQTIGEAVRSQPFGFSSNPPAGAEALILALGGGLDRAHALGVEHPAHRPTGSPVGSATQYDVAGNKVTLDGTDVIVSTPGGHVVKLLSGDRVYVLPAPGKFIYLGGKGDVGRDSDTHLYDFVSTASGPSVNVKARYF